MVDQQIRAICVLSNISLNINGLVKFTDNGDSTKIEWEISGLTKGKHGFHIHEFGNLSNGCTTAGAHYNPYKKTHGGPEDETRHVGDLGNVVADDSGVARGSIDDKLIKLSGPYSVIGRSIVCHEKEDDLGKGGNEESLKTGNAGARLCCGIIGLSGNF